MTEEKFDTESICRICLREHDKLFLIYDEKPVEHSVNLVEILNECTGYKVERFDKMPHQMCSGCINDARAAYRFKRTAGEAYRKLVSILGSAPCNNKGNCADSGTQTEHSSFYPCEMCDEKFFNSDELRHHRNVEHQNNLKCKICDKMFDKLRLLQLHQAQTHQVQNTVTTSLQCNICDRGFSRRDHVNRHMRSVHRKPMTERSEFDDKDQEDIDSLSFLEEPEMIVMEDASNTGLVPYWSEKLASNESESELLYSDDYETNPISSDDETKPDDGEIQENLWVAIEPEVNMELTETNEDTTMTPPAKLTTEIFDEQLVVIENSSVDHKQTGIATSSSIQCQVCQRTFTRECHLQRHMQSMHLARNKTSLSKLKGTNDNDTKTNEISFNGGDGGAESSDDLNKADDEADIDDALVTHIVYNVNSEPDDNEHTLDECIETVDNFLVKAEPVEADFNSTTKLDSDTSDFNLKIEETEDKHEFLIDDVTKNTVDVLTEKSAAETSTRSAVKSSNSKSKPKVEIVREYLQKRKRSTRKQRNDENPDNRCDLCQRTFSRHCHLLRHKLSHLEQKPHSCPHCPKTFARSDHLKAHITSLHGNKDFKCTICEAAFSRPDALERHKVSKHDGAVVDGHGGGRAVHIEAKLHACEYCEKKFTSKSYLRKHTLIHTDLLYACKSCDMTFKERQQLREHEKTHTSERNFLCCICGDSFARNDYLRVHMRRHNGEKPYKCKFCCKGFPRATDVKVHERYHTGTKPNLCTLCGKGFHRAYNLTIHMRTHTGERPYKCDQCPKSFTQSNDLKAHIRRHTGERYKCNECDACFLQLYAMRHHALSVHGTHIQSKTGRLQRTGLYEDPQSQTQITTVLVAPINFEPTTESQVNDQQQQQETSIQLTQLQTQSTEDDIITSAASFAPSSVETVVIQPETGAVQTEYISEYTVTMPTGILRFQPTISNHQPDGAQQP